MLLLRAFLSDDGFTLDALLRGNQKHKQSARAANSLLLAFMVGVAGRWSDLPSRSAMERANLGPRMARVIDSLDVSPVDLAPFTTSIAFVFSFGPRGLITYDLLGMKNAQMYGLTSTFAAET